jgi:signal transduction histidine kinase
MYISLCGSVAPLILLESGGASASIRPRRQETTRHWRRIHTRVYLAPLLALGLIGLVEGLYDLGLPVISPEVVLLLPPLYAASTAGWRVTALTSGLVAIYMLRHTYLNRVEYVSSSASISADDISRIIIFVVAVTGLVAIARYRERQRSTEGSLQEAYRNALEANRAKSGFLAVVSHELRTPLTAIIQYTDLLNAGIAGQVNPEQREMLQRIEGGALHLRAMIQRLLDYARLEGGGSAARRETVDLAHLVRHAVSLLETTAAEKGLEMRLVLPHAECPLHTDADRIRQIVLNLVENAIKFTETGSVTVEVGREPGGWLLRVTDTGIGIPPEARGAVFEPFWQGEDALTRTRSGLGLGLAITRELVTTLGGTIELASEQGRGTTFTVRFPEPAAAQIPAAG